MVGRQTPNAYILASLSFGLLFALAVTLTALRQPWLGLDLRSDAAGAVRVAAARGPAEMVPAGARLVAISGNGDRMELTARDLLVEPDGNLPRYADYDDFLARQDRLARIKQADTVELAGEDGETWTVAPRPARPLWSLPAEYWVQLFVGFTAWIIAALVWSFRRNDRSARYLLLSGFSTLMFSPFAAVYGTRELGMAAAPLRLFSDLNFLGGSVFVASLFSLLLYYPRPIAPRWAGLAVLAVFLGWFLAQQIGTFDSMVLARRLLVFVGLVGTFALAAVQWRMTQADPVARAALQWFLLSWLLGCTLFSAIIFVPQMFGIDTSALQAYAFLLFLLVYGGIAFGIVRYRLFDLGRWWASAVVWAASVLLLVALDIAFLFGLQLSSELSLAIALLICGVIWLPLRGWLWSRFADRRKIDTSGRFHHLVDAAFQTSKHSRSASWQRLLEDIFRPLSMETCARSEAPEILDDGAGLKVPGHDDAPALLLHHADKGRRLFTAADLETVVELGHMFDYLISNRSAFETGAATERKRIAGDVHDNIGASLLGALHSKDPASKDRLIRDTLIDLRSIINGTSVPGLPAADALVHLRRETAERLEAVGVVLDWETEGAEPTLSATQVHALNSILREAVSNVIKHARASRMTIRIATTDRNLCLTIDDDGIGFYPDANLPGTGLVGMADRVASLDGVMEWPRQRTPAGSRLVIRLPVAL